jgi:hypothetical protein
MIWSMKLKFVARISRSRLIRAIAIVAILTMAGAARADVTLVMFRHGEKPEMGLGQLSCQGFNRALALTDVLVERFGKPDALFAPDPGVTAKDRGKPYNYIRPLATLEPTAIRLSMPVNTRWGLTDLVPLQKELLGPDHAGQTIYIAWEHNLLVLLAQNIMKRSGADPALVPRWDDADFDRIYMLRVPTIGKATIEVGHEGLNAQSLRCPGQK